MNKNNRTEHLLNCQGLKNKLGLVQLLADDIEADVVSLNETNRTFFRLVNYNCARETKRDRKTLGTGTKAFVKTNHLYKMLREESIPKSGEIAVI